MYSGQIALFASQVILLFFHVGVRINSCLFTFMYMGPWEKTIVCCYKIYFVYRWWFYFHLLGACHAHIR